MEVLTDKRVSPLARVVYSFLAGCAFDGPRVRVGQRYVAESVGASQPTIHRCLRELAAAGHLEPVAAEAGRRFAYDLKSPVFSYTRARRYAGGLTSTVRAARAWAETVDSKPQ
jgi:DNA-binding IclR family transcriptional regulator